MRRMTLILMLAATSSGAMAEWVEVARSSGGVTDYIDTATILRGASPKAWVLTDYKVAQQVKGAEPFLSARKQMVFDCDNGMFFSRGHTFFSQNMGQGDVIFVLNEPRPEAPVPPGSAVSIFFKFMCSKS